MPLPEDVPLAASAEDSPLDGSVSALGAPAAGTEDTSVGDAKVEAGRSPEERKAAAPTAAPAAAAASASGGPTLFEPAPAAVDDSPADADEPPVPSKQTSGTSNRTGRRRGSRPPPLQLDPGAINSTEDEMETDWIPMQSRTQGRPYYYHTGTKETVWDKPPDYDPELPQGADGWVEMESRTQGRYYYYNQRTKECVWERPYGVPEPPPFERRQIDPRREYLREQITVWSEEFVAEHGREPSKEDIPEGSDIALMHRDYRMIKEEAEYDRLKKEQTELRRELDPNSLQRLREIKVRLQELESSVESWKKQKEQERERREKVTTTYNGWIKNFSEEHGRPPSEKDIPPGSEIAGMFREYQRYREDARRAKARQAKAEANRQKQRTEQDESRVRQWLADFEKQNGRKARRRDLPKDSEIERLYTEFVARLNPDSPAARERKEKLQARVAEWAANFERNHGRPPSQKDKDQDKAIASAVAELQRLGGDTATGTGGRKGQARREGRRSVVRSREGSRNASQQGSAGVGAIRRDDQAAADLWTDLTHELGEDVQSPSAVYRADRKVAQRGQAPAGDFGCTDCCLVM
eukprot:TRINITY_DN1875_c0_g2_i1.p1 TRINITY_DN1875_c0_g2~~TRINITY_DN1875_c0_g2_i1.p1  ORF type:complete len:581 (+),score=152.82 TRINITY_DN1875_c0_g2_i1:84-1826(+)